jgi:hypothetical protein
MVSVVGELGARLNSVKGRCGAKQHRFGFTYADCLQSERFAGAPDTNLRHFQRLVGTHGVPAEWSTWRI